MVILKGIGIIVGIVFVMALLVGLQCVVWFSYRACKKCGHNMDYKGLEEGGKNHYLFRCPKCGNWEYIPQETLFQDLNEGLNANENNV